MAMEIQIAVVAYRQVREIMIRSQRWMVTIATRSTTKVGEFALACSMAAMAYTGGCSEPPVPIVVHLPNAMSGGPILIIDVEGGNNKPERRGSQHHYYIDQTRVLRVGRRSAFFDTWNTTSVVDANGDAVQVQLVHQSGSLGCTLLHSDGTRSTCNAIVVYVGSEIEWMEYQHRHGNTYYSDVTELLELQHVPRQVP